MFWDVFAIIGLVNNDVEGVGGLTKVLFADHDVGVSLFFEEVGKGWEVGVAGHAVFPHAVNGGVQAGDETAARGVAYRRTGEGVCPCVNITPSAARRSAWGEWAQMDCPCS